MNTTCPICDGHPASVPNARGELGPCPWCDLDGVAPLADPKRIRSLTKTLDAGELHGEQVDRARGLVNDWNELLGALPHVLTALLARGFELKAPQGSMTLTKRGDSYAIHKHVIHGNHHGNSMFVGEATVEDAVKHFLNNSKCFVEPEQDSA